MDNILIADTETSDPAHQRVVQLGALLCKPTGEPIEKFETLIRPDGWEICERFVGIHGITTEMCRAKGIPMLDALSRLQQMMERAKKKVFHNMNFDNARILNEATIYQATAFVTQWQALAGFCTMLANTDILKLPKPSGRGGYKWPKLQECHKFYFGMEFGGDHDAMNDTEATARIYFEMHKPREAVKPVESASAEVKPDDLTSQAPI